MIDKQKLNEYFDAFSSFIFQKDGASFPFPSSPYFMEAESYKADIYKTARENLKCEEWTEQDIGTGKIIDCTIVAIEVNDNNLMTVDGRYGEKGKGHYSLIAVKSDSKLMSTYEKLLYDFYKSNIDDQNAFNQFIKVASKKYSFIAYLFFIKDYERFLPIAPAVFDSIFVRLNIKHKMSYKCSWDNYVTFNNIIMQIRDFLSNKVQGDVSLLDAHSFVWFYHNVMNSLSERTSGFNIEWLLDNMDSFSEKNLGSNIETPILFSSSKILTFKYRKIKKCFLIRSKSPVSDIIIFEYKPRDMIFRFSVQEKYFDKYIEDLILSCKNSNKSGFIPHGVEKLPESRIHPHYRSYDLNIFEYPLNVKTKAEIIDLLLKVYSYISNTALENILDNENAQEKFDKQVKISKENSPEERQKRLKRAQKKPSSGYAITSRYNRNPDVVAEVLYQARGTCAGCNKPAPFERKDGSPYLEVHHIVFLANGGDDTVENSEALCPNCHKQRHYGKVAR